MSTRAAWRPCCRCLTPGGVSEALWAGVWLLPSSQQQTRASAWWTGAESAGSAELLLWKSFSGVCLFVSHCHEWSMFVTSLDNQNTSGVEQTTPRPRIVRRRFDVSERLKSWERLLHAELSCFGALEQSWPPTSLLQNRLIPVPSSGTRPLGKCPIWWSSLWWTPTVQNGTPKRKKNSVLTH